MWSQSSSGLSFSLFLGLRRTFDILGLTDCRHTQLVLAFRNQNGVLYRKRLESRGKMFAFSN